MFMMSLDVSANEESGSDHKVLLLKRRLGWASVIKGAVENKV